MRVKITFVNVTIILIRVKITLCAWKLPSASRNHTHTLPVKITFLRVLIMITLVHFKTTLMRVEITLCVEILQNLFKNLSSRYIWV
jgi:hypothetical protein